MPAGEFVCPVCKHSMEQPSQMVGAMDAYLFDCAICGKFQISGTADQIFQTKIRNVSPRTRAAISHYIRVRAGQNPPVTITTEIGDRLISDPYLPNVFEQSENLLRYIARETEDPGLSCVIEHNQVWSLVGAQSDDGVAYLIEELSKQGFVRLELKTYSSTQLFLTFDGWRRCDQLKRGATTGNRAFMAMKFGDAVLDMMFTNHFREAVSQTGFALRRLDDEPKHGLIDDRLRVEIKSSRFLIADLTHDNNGAYWEAGYAEGLGKPVIYTCSKERFGKGGTHFDTNHHLTVIWDQENPAAACDLLKATIRNSLPDARLED